MLFNALPVLLLFIATAVIALIIARRLPDIAAIQVETIIEAKTAEVKRQLLVQRLERKVREAFAKAWSSTQPHRAATVQRAHTLFERLLVVEQQMRSHKTSETTLANDTLVAEALVDAPVTHAPVASQTEAALRPMEAEYLERIKLNHYDAAAYRDLGFLYRDLEQYEEAKETLQYALRHAPEAITAETLGRVEEALGHLPEAAEAYMRALELDGENPAYLDRLALVCILLGQKRRAKAVLVRLERADRTHASLPELKQLVEGMPTKRSPRVAKKVEDIEDNLPLTE